MAVNKIKISANTRKVLNKTKEILGIQGENMKDVLFFVLSEKIDGTAVVEIELPSGAQSFVELTKVEDGYELPVKSVLTEQAGFVKFQLRILQNKVEVFKSEIFELEVKESLNAIYEEPDQYPTWLDKLENLQSELNEEENKRVLNEEERVNAEEKRKRDFEQIQKNTENTINNIKDLTDKYDSNATEKTKDFNKNYIQKKEEFDNNCSEATTNFNDNAKLKYDDYNKNADDKISNYNNNHDEKITAFNSNEKAKTDTYNLNATKKLEEYNSNDKTKTEAYNTNASTKLNNYNSNVTTKENEYNSNAKNKTNEFNNNASEKLEEYNQNAESLINRVVECETENERLREDIKSIAIVGEESGENIHIEDSSNARCEIEIGGNQQQDARIGKNRINLGLLGSGTLNGVTYTYNESSQSITFNGTCTKDNTRFIINDDANIQTIAKKTTLTAQYLAGSVSNYFTARIADNEWKHNLLLSLLTLNSSNNKVSLTETEDMVGVHVDIKANNGTIFNNFTIQLMLTDEVDTEYEMYGASPSFAYPSPIKAVGDVRNILDMSNAKGGTSGGITCNMIADGSYTYKGTASSKAINIWLLGSYNNKTSIFRLEPGTYYIDGVVLFDGNNVLANPDTAKIFTFINAHDITGVRVLDAVLENTYDETKYPIIAEIDHEIPWVPYEMGYIKVNEFNKNYLSKIPKKSITTQGITSTFDGEKFICKGTAMYNYFNLVTQRIQQHFKAGTYTFSSNMFEKGRACIRFYYEDGTADTYYSNINTKKISFTLKKDAYAYFLMVDGLTVGGGDLIDCIIKLQLEDGNTATEIEKAENQEYLVDVQQEMLKGDTFVRKDGKWYEKHCVKTEIMLTFPTTNIEVCGTFANFQINRNIAFAVVKNDLKITNVRNDILCDKLKAKDNSMWGGKEDGIQTYINSNKFMISIPFEDIEKNFGEELTINNYSQAFRKYINDNGPFKIYYLLEEPELVECTEAQSKVLDEIYNKAHTYKNITNISAESSEVNPIICLKYLKDPETEHNKLQAQIDEIKQLLSTTQTSSLLLDNMQKDLESEV